MSAKPPPRAGTAIPPTSASAVSLPKREHTTTLSHRLLHMFDNSKHANFAVNVVIHELSNVPQLDGEFAANWKFRGKKPKGKDAVMHEKPSLPNLRIGTPMSSVYPSSSDLSLRSTSTKTSSPLSPLHPITAIRHGLGPSHLGDNGKGKSATMPVTPPSGYQDIEGVHSPEKKVSDPTPLREGSIEGRDIPRTSSPEPLREPLPIDDEEGDQLRKISGESRRSGLARLSGETGRSFPTNGSRGSSMHAETVPVSLNSSRVNSLAPSASSSVSNLSVPFPRSSFPLPGARSGTSASPGTLIDPVPGHHDSILSSPASSRNPMPGFERRGVVTSLSSGTSTSTTIPRSRTVSAATYKDQTYSSTNRKGHTPAKHLKNHSCLWDYELQYTVRIPLSKPTAVGPYGGTVTPGRKQSGPILGAGPLSESGFRLIIDQLPTPMATTDAKPVGLEDVKHSDLTKAAISVEKKLGDTLEQTKKAAIANKTEFGVVDLDLAAFAGKGRVTRRFLLRGSRTNAVVRLTVEMKWLGGEANWTAPPMQEGHHVTGISDIADPVLEAKLRDDLKLGQTTSNSSSTSSSSPNHSHPSLLGLALSRNHSATSLTGAAPQNTYKPYQHHLKPEDARRPSPKRDHSKLSNISTSTTKHPSAPETPTTAKPARDSSSNDLLTTPTAENTPGSTSAGPETPLYSPSILYDKPHTNIFGLHRHKSSKHGHGHHHHNFRHHHHSHHLRDASMPKSGIHHLPADFVIEAVFNPKPAAEEGPFTYVLKNLEKQAPGSVESEKDVLNKWVESAQEKATGNNTKVIKETGDKDKGDGTGNTANALAAHRLAWTRVRGKTFIKEKHDKKDRENSYYGRMEKSIPAS